MNGRTARRLRKGLFDAMVQSKTVQRSGYAIKTVRKKDGEQGQMLVLTGFRKIYREMKRDLKLARRAEPQGNPERNEKMRARKRRARARARAEYRRRAAEILAARRAEA